MLEIIGCAATAPTALGPASCYLLQSKTGVIVVDTGPGSLAVFAESHSLDSVRGIIVTHFHADHSLDLMAWAYRWTFPTVRERIPLLIPAGEEARIRSFDALFGIPTLAPMRTPIASSFDIASMPRDGATKHAIDGVDIHSFAAHHAVPSAVIRATLPDDRIVAFSSDTGVCDPLLEAADTADLFVCEATYLDASDDKFSGHGHLTARLAGEVAQRAGAKCLVLTHLADPADGDQAVLDASSEYGGDVVLASPGLVIAR